MATPDPLAKSHPATSKSQVSSTTYTIAGIICTVHGLQELPESTKELAVLWLLHPRLSNQARMAPTATQAITHWNTRQSQSNSQGKAHKGLITVSFDQRNHGSRLADPLANEAWRQKNPRHAQDMYSIYQGTARDTSLLLSHLGSYLPAHLPEPTQHLVLGISLGGHAAWHVLLEDPRVTAGVVVIGCPDFTRLMLQRAEKSRLTTFGPQFLGSTDFPKALGDEIARSDPAGLFLPQEMKAPRPTQEVANVIPQTVDQAASKALLSQRLGGKSILNLSGGADKLVPYACGETFVKFVKGAIDAKAGWWQDSGLLFDDRVFDGVGHEMTPEMAKAAVSFIGDVLAGKRGKDSKI